MKTMKNFIQKVFKGDPMIWGLRNAQLMSV